MRPVRSCTIITKFSYLERFGSSESSTLISLLHSSCFLRFLGVKFGSVDSILSKYSVNDTTPTPEKENIGKEGNGTKDRHFLYVFQF